MQAENHLLVFQIDQRRFGVHISNVRQVVPAVEITPLPEAPPTVMGAINVHGVVTPVVNTRKRLGLPERPIALTDYMVISTMNDRPLAIPVDAVEGIVDYSKEELIALTSIIDESMGDVVKIVDGLLVVYDPDRTFSDKEQSVLALAVERFVNAN